MSDTPTPSHRSTARPMSERAQTGREGLYRHQSSLRLLPADAIAIGLSAVWVIGVLVFWSVAGTGDGSGWLLTVMGVLAAVLPLVLIWVAASAAKASAALRAEAEDLRHAISALAGVNPAGTHESAELAELSRKLDALTAAQQGQQVALAQVLSERQVERAPDARAAVEPDTVDAPQPSLHLGTPPEELVAPISVAEFIRAMNFPDTEADKEGFRALRRALEDRGVQQVIRASQDVLTLLSQDGIYMDDLTPDRARPELWRRFAQGERGRSVAGLGGIHDRSSLALSSGRMKSDAVFRDAVHHFLRHFDRVFLQFEKHATDEDIARLANTRTARAFMLLGRVTGTFD
ncbi:MAG: hypothetical protein AAF700_15710 [Pseudomonadota bacterium]